MKININSIKSLLGYNKRNVTKETTEKFSLNPEKVKVEEDKLPKLPICKDSVYISEEARDYLKPNGLGVSIDKETGIRTTLYVDRETFKKIINYSANNLEYKWDEMGFDGKKKWIVINEQRFQYNLTEEEKFLFRKENEVLVDYVLEGNKDKILDNEDKKNLNFFKVECDIDNRLNFYGSKEILKNEKIKNLMKNSKVLRMLFDICKNNNNEINLSI